MMPSRNKRLHKRHVLSCNRGYPLQGPTGHKNPEAGGGLTCCDDARGAAGLRSVSVSMKRSIYLACLAVLVLSLAAPGYGAVAASVSGVVSDSAGVPQIGAQVQLLRPDLSVIASVYTDASGHFLITSLLPGRYALKAIGPSFLPSLRENVRVRTGTVVNLSLSTLYEVLQWLPAEPRVRNTETD